MSRFVFWLGLSLFGVMLLSAIFAPFLAPDSTLLQHLPESLHPPSAGHWLGQNHHGQDLLSMVLYGARASLVIGTATVLISSVVGALLGLYSGYAGGAVDRIISGITEVVLAFPGMLLAIAVAAVLGPSVINVVIALSISGWVPFCRLARAQTLSLKEREFVLAARSVGARTGRILFRHILPNLSGPLLVQATFAMSAAILAESGLSFLGLGVPAGTPSWGKAVSDGCRYLFAAPHMATFPGIAIMLAVLSFHWIGDGMRIKIYGQR